MVWLVRVRTRPVVALAIKVSGHNFSLLSLVDSSTLHMMRTTYLCISFLHNPQLQIQPRFGARLVR